MTKGPSGESGRRVRNKNTGKVGVELTPYGWPRYEIRSVLWDGDNEPTTVGITVLEDELSGETQPPCDGCGREAHDGECDLLAMIQHGITLADAVVAACLDDDESGR